MLSSPVASSKNALATSSSTDARSSACAMERTGGQVKSFG